MCSGTQRTGAERQPVVRIVHSVQEPSDVLVARHDARQPQYLQGWIVGMHTHIHPILLTHRHDSREEITHVLAQGITVYTFIQAEQLAEDFHRLLVVFLDISVHEPLCLDNDVFHQLMVVLRCHHGLFPFHLFHDVRPVVGLCPFTFQDAAIEISEVGTVEIERRRAVRVRVLQVGTRPVEHGHEIVAYRLDACLTQIGQTHDIILY